MQEIYKTKNIVKEMLWKGKHRNLLWSWFKLVTWFGQISIDKISYISNSLQDELDIFQIYFWEFYLHEVQFFLLIILN